MSVGKKLESYLPTLCEITDINAEFRKWIKKRAGKRIALQRIKNL